MYGGVTLETNASMVADPHHTASGLPMQPEAGDLPMGGALYFRDLPGGSRGLLWLANLPTEKVQELQAYCELHPACDLTVTLRQLCQCGVDNCTCGVVMVAPVTGGLAVRHDNKLREVSLSSQALGALHGFA
jgi:hypothetical protein